MGRPCKSLSLAAPLTAAAAFEVVVGAAAAGSQPIADAECVLAPAVWPAPPVCHGITKFPP